MAATKVGFRRSFEIAGRQVGDGAPAYVIAEAGANHNRDLDMAKQLIDVAAESGADAVKFQTYTGKDLYSSKTPPLRVPGRRAQPARAARRDRAAARMAA